MELMKPSAMMFLAGGGNILATKSDNLIIGVFLGPRAVLVFDLTKRAFGILLVLATHFHGAFKPALAHFFGELDDKAVSARGLMDSLIHCAGVAAMVLMGGFVILDRAFVGLWVGSSFYAGDLVVILIGMFGLLSSQTLALHNILFAKGRFYTVAVAGIAEALLYLTLATVMVRWLGLTGVALAGVVSLAAGGWWLLWRRYCRDFHISWSEALGQMLPLAGVGVGLLAIGLFLRHLATPATAPAFLCQCAFYLGATSLWVLWVDRRMRGLVADILQRRPVVFSGPT
jgi:O-antigen/teichoic acid export membrane protein